MARGFPASLDITFGLKFGDNDDTGQTNGSLTATLANGGELLNVQLEQSSPCRGEFTGTATVINNSELIINYSGSDCGGIHANANWHVTRH